MAEVVICKNCDQEVPAQSYVMHEIHCARNFLKCIWGEVLKVSEKDLHRCKLEDFECEWGAIVNKKDKEAHDQEFHALMKCPQCNDSMVAYLFKLHDCPMKPRQCQYCEAMFTPDLFTEHIIQCASRTQLCPKCNKYIPNRDWEFHTTMMDCLNPNPASTLEDRFDVNPEEELDDEALARKMQEQWDMEFAQEVANDRPAARQAPAAAPAQWEAGNMEEFPSVIGTQFGQPGTGPQSMIPPQIQGMIPPEMQGMIPPEMQNMMPQQFDNRMDPSSMSPQMDRMVQPGFGNYGNPEQQHFSRPEMPSFPRPEASRPSHPDMPDFEIDNEDPELNEAIMASLQMSQLEQDPSS